MLKKEVKNHPSNSSSFITLEMEGQVECTSAF